MPATPERAQTVMAFDYGGRRIGVAVGQTLTGSASPLETLACRDGQPDRPALDRLIDQWRPGRLVVGLPLRDDGSDSPQTQAARRFAAELEQHYTLPVDLHDERLSSNEAKDRIRTGRQNGTLTRRSRREDIDKLAAAVILRSWFEENR